MTIQNWRIAVVERVIEGKDGLKYTLQISACNQAVSSRNDLNHSYHKHSCDMFPLNPTRQPDQSDEQLKVQEKIEAGSQISPPPPASPVDVEN